MGAHRRRSITDPAELGEHRGPVQRPLDRAVLAVADPTNETAVLVLGVDGLWRRVDGVDLVRVHDGVGYESPSLQATSLSPDATKLALPQPGSLVVVDLTTGDSTRYDAGGQTNQWVTWADDTHVLLNNEEDATGVLVDLATGTTLPSSFGPSTAFLPDGSAVTWQGLWFERGDGTLVPTDVTNSARLNPSPPLANADVLVGLDGYAYGRGESPTYRVAVVDGVTGDSLAFQPLGTGGGVADQLLGWDGDRIVLALVNQNISASYTAVVAWDWKQQKLDPLVVLPGWAVSWGQGWADGVAAN